MNKITAKEGYLLADKERKSFFKELCGNNLSIEDYDEILEKEANEIIEKNKAIEEIDTLEKVDKIVFDNSIIPEVMNIIQMSNEEAIERTSLFPTWESYINNKIEKGIKFQYNNKLYEVIQTVNVVLENQTPNLVPANYALLSEHEGTLEDPIPYERMMLIKKDKYYTQFGKLYIGILDAPNGYDDDLANLTTLVKEILKISYN